MVYYLFMSAISSNLGPSSSGASSTVVRKRKPEEPAVAIAAEVLALMSHGSSDIPEGHRLKRAKWSAFASPGPGAAIAAFIPPPLPAPAAEALIPPPPPPAATEKPDSDGDALMQTSEADSAPSAPLPAAEDPDGDALMKGLGTDPAPSPATPPPPDVTAALLKAAITLEDGGREFARLADLVPDDDFVMAHDVLVEVTQTPNCAHLCLPCAKLYQIVLRNVPHINPDYHIDVFAVGFYLDLPEGVAVFWRKLTPAQQNDTLTKFIDQNLIADFPVWGTTLWNYLAPFLHAAPYDITLAAMKQMVKGHEAHPKVHMSRIKTTVSPLGVHFQNHAPKEKIFEFFCLLGDLGFLPKGRFPLILQERSIRLINYYFNDTSIHRWRLLADLATTVHEKWMVFEMAKIRFKNKTYDEAKFNAKCLGAVKRLFQDLSQDFSEMSVHTLAGLVEAAVFFKLSTDDFLGRSATALLQEDCTVLQKERKEAMLKIFANYPEVMVHLNK